MERSKYLEMCKRCSLLPRLPGGLRKVPEELKVFYDEQEYYPKSYELRYDNGNIIHLAHLASLNVHGITIAPLDKVKERKNNE